MLQPARRRMLFQTTRLALAGTALPLFALPAFAASTRSETRSLKFDHTHTGEKIAIVYAAAGEYLPQAEQQLNHFLRDHYTGEVGHIDPRSARPVARSADVAGCKPGFPGDLRLPMPQNQ